MLGTCATLSERDARRILKQKQLELTTGYQLLHIPSAPLFHQFAADYLAWYSAEHPHSYYRVEQIVRQWLRPAFDFLPLDAIKPRDVETWKQRRLQSAKGTTVGKEVRTLKAMLRKAVAWELLQRSPIESVSEPKRLDSKPPQFYVVDELRRLYDASTPQHAAIWRLYANTGMRRGEGLALKWESVGKESILVLSTDEERTKSGKWREVPLTDGAKEALRVLSGGEDYVLPRMYPASLSRACIRDATAAGIGGGIHTLRHTYISHLVMAGVDIRTVQILAGHSTVAVTERYAHLGPSHLKSAGRAITL